MLEESEESREILIFHFTKVSLIGSSKVLKLGEPMGAVLELLLAAPGGTVICPSTKLEAEESSKIWNPENNKAFPCKMHHAKCKVIISMSIALFITIHMSLTSNLVSILIRECAGK